MDEKTQSLRKRFTMMEDTQISFLDYINWLKERGVYLKELEGSPNYQQELHEKYENFIKSDFYKVEG